MQRRREAQRKLGVVVYALGILLAVALAATSIWADLEASLFVITERGEKSLNSLRCPVIIARGETGQVTASFKNTGTRPVNRAIRAYISQGFVTLIRDERLHLPLEPGETKRLSWAVTSDDAAYGFLILARVSTLRQSPMPSQSRACGILVLNLPAVSGAVFTGAWLLLGLAGILGGGWLWWRATRPLAARQQSAAIGMTALAALVGVALLVGLLGYWLLGVLLLAVIVLFLIAFLAQSALETG